MPEGGFMFHVKDERVVPVDWTEYARISSVGFNLLPKWNVAAALLFLAVNYGKIQDPSLEKLWKGINADDIPAHKQIFAMECISTTMELIENFCAMCYAYAGALDNGPRYFPLLLRDFGKITQVRYPKAKLRLELDGVENFLHGVSESSENLVKYLACAGRPSSVISEARRNLLILKRFSEKNRPWYNKFKHSNSIIPVSAIFDVPGSYSALHMLPGSITWKDSRVVLRDVMSVSIFKKRYSEVLMDEVALLRTESIFGALESLDDVGGVLDCLNIFWQPIRAAQHKLIFGQEIAIYQRGGRNLAPG
jgi:hypothetical protein